LRAVDRSVSPSPPVGSVASLSGKAPARHRAGCDLPSAAGPASFAFALLLEEGADEMIPSPRGHANEDRGSDCPGARYHGHGAPCGEMRGESYNQAYSERDEREQCQRPADRSVNCDILGPISDIGGAGLLELDLGIEIGSPVFDYGFEIIDERALRLVRCGAPEIFGNGFWISTGHGAG